mgnify:CR=1 FL=1
MKPALPRVILHDTQTSFHCQPDQPLLEAAYEAGLALPYACRRGICGLCMAQLMGNEVLAQLQGLPTVLAPITRIRKEELA